MSGRALYLPAGDGRFDPTELTRGPWDPGHQHGGPPAALLARAVERAGRIAPGLLARASFDILRPIPIAPVRVAARILRPGRRVEQIEATLSGTEDDAPLMRATAWRVRASPVAVPEAAPEPLPGPETGRPARFGFWHDDVSYQDALDWRLLEGDLGAPGPATVWARLLVPLVAGEEATSLQRLLVMADAASGISAVLDWDAWSFVNIDLGIHLERAAEGEWTAMAAATRPGPSGAAVCSSVLSDARGRVGMSTQSLVVIRR